MSQFPKLVYVIQERKTAGLSQVELAELLGYDESFVRKCEAGERRPPARLLLGCEYIFAKDAALIFPEHMRSFQEEIARNGTRIDKRLRDKEDRVSRRKLELLRGLIDRMASSTKP